MHKVGTYIMYMDVTNNIFTSTLSLSNSKIKQNAIPKPSNYTAHIEYSYNLNLLNNGT